MEKIRKILVPILCLIIAIGSSITYMNKGNVIIERGNNEVKAANEAMALPVEVEKTEEKEEKGKVDLNTATRDELQIAPGIGPAKADAIIKYREEYGNFTSVDELIEISGIGEKTLAKIRDYYVVK